MTNQIPNPPTHEEVLDEVVGKSRLKMPAKWQWFADAYKSTYATLERTWGELADLKKQVADLQSKLAAATAFTLSLSQENAKLKAELDALKAAASPRVVPSYTAPNPFFTSRNDRRL